MKCRIFYKSLKDYIVGELSEESNDMMAKHMEKCEKCKAAYNDQLDAFQSIDSMASIENVVFSSSREEILRNIDKTRYSRRITNKANFFFKRNSLRYAVGSVAVFIILIFSFFMTSHFKDIKLAHILPSWSLRDDTSPDTSPDKSGDTVYKNGKFGFSFTMPESWNGKYTVKEAEDGIYVYFKPIQPVRAYSGLLFAILKKGSIDESHFDTVGEPRNLEAKGILYIVGGPTDLSFPDDNKEFGDFTKLQKEVKDVVKTIKAINDNKSGESTIGNFVIAYYSVNQSDFDFYKKATITGFEESELADLDNIYETNNKKFKPYLSDKSYNNFIAHRLCIGRIMKAYKDNVFIEIKDLKITKTNEDKKAKTIGYHYELKLNQINKDTKKEEIIEVTGSLTVVNENDNWRIVDVIS